MTVSSVKNLNGETFSAVQDASLTDIVSSNSANWNEISAYQANSASYLQNTDLTIVDNKITEISGVPISAGGDVPEGVMVESGLEYNAVNEISGYNGSAIAQYGAEKQWLVHDDTLVHAANSAQYALGVNLSAVAQLLGVDETVLFETTSNDVSAVSLTEPLSAFERFRLYPFQAGAGVYYFGEFDYDQVQTLATGNNIRLLYSRGVGGTNPFQFLYGDYTLSDDTKSITAVTGVRRWFPASTGTGGTDSNKTYIKKIVGIGRRQ